MAKSIKKAYFFWLFGGLFGLHHFYLKRDKQAFVWFTTLGGFVIGFLRDIYRIPEYLREVNEDEEQIKKLKKQQSQLKTPIFMTTRFIGSIAVGSFYGYVTKYCLTYSELEKLQNNDENNDLVISCCTKILSSLVTSVFVYLVGTEGPIKCKFRWPLLGSYLALLFDTIRNYDSNYSAAILSTLFLNWNLEWDRKFIEKRKNKKLGKRIFYLTLGSIIIGSLFSLFLWNNVTLEFDGKKVTLKESVYKFWNSKEMNQAAEIFKMIWNFYKTHGLRRLINHFVYGFDPEVIANAYKTLELDERSTQQDIDSKCKMLSRKWHPDKYKDPEKKLAAEKMFMDIQESCNRLSDHRRKKFDQNQKSEI